MRYIKNNLVSTVHHLADNIGERSYRHREKLDEAADFIEERFNSYKCRTERQAFNHGDNTFFNVIAEVKGSDPLQKEILVIGAHYDTVAGTPGADDNASGVAGMLELARISAINPSHKTIRFVAFTLEEPPFFLTRHMGSYKYAEKLKKDDVSV